ncbi:MAG: peptidyl-tRNA hydrolase Pth2 [Thermoplasmata archaeon]|nr:peptidyl-tRNA hydrolase Pth2 [Thermoplasmata archaeon]
MQKSTSDREFRYKQVIVVRKDLKLSRGKLAVQVAHAAVTACERCRRDAEEWFERWFAEGQKKVVVEVDNLDALILHYEQAKREGLPAALIEDAGLTEIPPGTITCAGIGPAPAELVDKITGGLKLL